MVLTIDLHFEVTSRLLCLAPHRPSSEAETPNGASMDLLHFEVYVWLHTVPCPGSLRTALSTSVSFLETLRESTVFLLVYILKVLESLAQRPSLCITQSGTSPPAASLVAVQIHGEGGA